MGQRGGFRGLSAGLFAAGVVVAVAGLLLPSAGSAYQGSTVVGHTTYTMHHILRVEPGQLRGEGFGPQSTLSAPSPPPAPPGWAARGRDATQPARPSPRYDDVTVVDPVYARAAGLHMSALALLCEAAGAAIVLVAGAVVVTARRMPHRTG